MNIESQKELLAGLTTAYIDGNVASDLSYRPLFVSNDYRAGKKVLASLEDELLRCDSFQISVAFITMGGITPLLQTLKALEQKGVQGKILTTNYLNFSEPKALERLHSLKNITIKMYDTDAAEEGFHTKGYIFKKEEIYRIIIGSSNMTSAALTSNKEWNTKLVSTENGEVAKEILAEFEKLWNSPSALVFDQFYKEYKLKYEMIKRQKQIAGENQVVSLEQFRLQPNRMQLGFIQNLKELLQNGQNRALLISATGTGKTYASAFAMRELGFKRVLFVVHRGQLAIQTMKSYKRVMGNTFSMGFVGSGHYDYDKDFVFATVQTLNKDQHLMQYSQDAFDCIILDEAHHSSADTYQRLMSYFTPRMWLGMTATPDKRDDTIAGRNIYEIFDHCIAYEIRLQQAMEENLLCPFHYFGISDLSVIDDTVSKTRNLSEPEFNLLTGEERVRHIVEAADYYGHSGDRVKGLIFCSRIDESIELSRKLNETMNPEAGRYFRTLALNGDASPEERQDAFDRLASDNEDGTETLDYIISVDILNEGVDIVEVNQVIMLRPTQSPIVFIQQLGRGLRKAAGKEYVVILDFIGNYTNNFMIPIALSGDRSYNPDTIRKYVISGNNVIPGASTVHFDEIAKEKIFSSIDRIKGMKTIIRESYLNVKNRLGRIPYMIDFMEHDEVDPLLIIREYKSYAVFLESVEPDTFQGKLSEDEKLSLEYLSKTVLSGVRPYELEILQKLLMQDSIDYQIFSDEFVQKYGYRIDEASYLGAISVLQGHFVSKEDEYLKYRSSMQMFDVDDAKRLKRLTGYAARLQHLEYRRQIKDIIRVGLKKYEIQRQNVKAAADSRFIPYAKYSRRDVCLIMNCGKDLSSTMYGMKRIGDDVFIFVTYHKVGGDDGKEYADGKPDYADAFEDSIRFRWDSQIGRGINSSYVADVCESRHKHLLIKKSDAESSYYYIGEFQVSNISAAKKKDNKGKERDITKFKMKLNHPVREDVLRYFESDINQRK